MQVYEQEETQQIIRSSCSLLAKRSGRDAYTLMIKAIFYDAGVYASASNFPSSQVIAVKVGALVGGTLMGLKWIVPSRTVEHCISEIVTVKGKHSCRKYIIEIAQM